MQADVRYHHIRHKWLLEIPVPENESTDACSCCLWYSQVG